MRPFSIHDRFFSSLKQAMHAHAFFLSVLIPHYVLINYLILPISRQVENRLASEKEPTTIATPSSPSSLSSPLYLSSCKPQPAAFKPCNLDESSCPPSEFLSVQPSPEHESGQPEAGEAQKYHSDEEENEEKDDDDDDDINRLISLLGLSADGEEGGVLSSCHCSGGGFYRNVVGNKGPMCAKEMQRLDGWIKHYRRVRSEPARLVHLLLAKAASVAASSEGDDDGLGGIGFPPTVEEFLKHDPPFEKGE